MTVTCGPRGTGFAELLVVLLTEEGAGGLHDVEELGDDRGRDRELKPAPAGKGGGGSAAVAGEHQ